MAPSLNLEDESASQLASVRNSLVTRCILDNVYTTLRKLDALSSLLRLLLYSGENIFTELILTTLEGLGHQLGQGNSQYHYCPRQFRPPACFDCFRLANVDLTKLTRSRYFFAVRVFDNHKYLNHAPPTSFVGDTSLQPQCSYGGLGACLPFP